MSEMTIDKHGNQFWKNEAGQFHRVDAPALIRADGSQAWYVDGKLHRIDGPAVIGADEYQAWFIDGLRHRLDGPAIIYSDGTQSWWVDGKLHRIDGPAIIRPDGSEVWCINDINLTDQVKFWMKENDFPDCNVWTDSQKIMFRLAFSGNAS